MHNQQARAVLVSSHPEQGSALLMMQSQNGIQWTTKNIISLSQQNVSAPFMFIDGSIQQLWYASDNDGLFSIYVRSCSEETCINDTHRILAPTAHTWYDQQVASPFVMKRGNTYYLFFSGKPNHGGTWQIGMATSPDGNAWSVCPKSLIREGDGPFVIDHNGKYYLVYHMPFYTGIKIATLSGTPTCESVWEDLGYLIQPNNWYNESHTIDPSFIWIKNTPLLYYFGRDTQGVWHMNIATHYKSVMVLLPGMLASWNEDALLHNDPTTSEQWHIAPFVHEYDGLLTTLAKLDYQQGRDVYVFAYDWRQHLSTTIQQLHAFLEETVWNFDPVVQIKLVGHSLGGLTGRLYAQQYPTNIEQLITIGSPHQGSASSYKPLAAGELDRSDTNAWLAAKIIYILNQTRFDTARETFQKSMPVLFDLLPTYPFLVTSEGAVRDIASMTLRNELIPAYNSQLGDILPAIATQIYGTSRSDTLWGYKVKEAGTTHKLVQNYADGEPYESVLVSGDYTVPAITKLEDVPSIPLNLDHQQLVYTEEGIVQILNTLGISYEPADIHEGAPTVISPALVFLKQSPVTMRVENSSSVFEEHDGIIFIPNAPADTYRLIVSGTGYGTYHIYIGQITAENDVWDTVSGIVPGDKDPRGYESTILFPFNPKRANPIKDEKVVAVIPFGINQENKTNPTANQSQSQTDAQQTTYHESAAPVKKNAISTPIKTNQKQIVYGKRKNDKSPTVLGESTVKAKKSATRSYTVASTAAAVSIVVFGGIWLWFYRRRRKNTARIRS
ncbi:hypothetical protein COU89_02460 [Candidatus Roizmanbacteria bacterium CG10_big_fil_rev_8_21_14_0_10_45_7]|uniref:Uncharacterized protein n=1 Tax=Candidatus Roizmanbacteria bacterium CG10_big_fil_rev_8_21_14_0_10_45_7 TaxID=1974854 RepID=A0A2M8KUN1_9BACT|nr:MAG: hypothetical protein COU89_02460 [Candidatus Roizmanbacteria bacterium CG10_big_fil_rev_8_21_14_0_10_45_7]